MSTPAHDVRSTPSSPFSSFRQHHSTLRLLLIITAGLLWAGCDSGGPEPSERGGFGLEEGFYYYVGKERHPLTLDRSYLAIRFHDHVGRERAEEILKEHGMINLGPQDFNGPFPVPNYVRLTQHPAEHYYTTYGEGPRRTLGDEPEVQYALPVFISKDERHVHLTNWVGVIFRPGVDSARAEVVLDSLARADGLERLPPIVHGAHYFLVPKSSPLNPLDRANAYVEFPFLEAAFPNFAFLLELYGPQPE